MTTFSDFPAYFSPLPTPSRMAAWDATTQEEVGIPGIVLMENAARAFTKLLLERAPDVLTRPCAILVGSGNNGGDAAAVGRCLHEAGASVTLYCVRKKEDTSPSCALQLSIAEKLSLPIKELSALVPDAPEVVVDGLLGTGFTKTMRGDLAAFVETVNAQHYPLVAAIDIPSGLDGETGEPSPTAIRAHMTICMEAIKQGLLLPSARPFTGTAYAVPIGIPALIKRSCPAETFLMNDALGHIGFVAPENSHKMSFGRVGVLGGGINGHTGAAHLAARAALRTGAGLVTVFAPKEHHAEIHAGLPELMLVPHGKTELSKTVWNDTPPSLLPDLSCLVIGPGMGLTEDAHKTLCALLEAPNRPPLVLDADALTLLARDRDRLSLLREDDYMTPHPGEAARLLGTDSVRVQRDRFQALADLCQAQKGVVVLKGANTLVGQGDKPRAMSPWDVPQLAVAGAGDVLAGLLAALVAQRNMLSLNRPSFVRKQPHPPVLSSNSLTPSHGSSLSPQLLACIAVALHVCAAREAAKRCPARGILASELADAIPSLFTPLEGGFCA